MSWNVLITARTITEVGKGAVELLRGAGCKVVIPARLGPLEPPDLLPLLAGTQAVLASPDRYSAAVLNSAEAADLKIISRWGVGFDSIDHQEAARLGIAVAYTPGLLNETVADYAFALLLALARRVHEGHMAMRQGEWKGTWGHDVAGKTLGILGCGRIGQAVARRASGFNLRVIAHDVAPSPEAEKLGIEFVSFEELLSTSHFLSLHAALTPTSKGLIGESELRKMQKNAYLINTARGALVDEMALVKALEEGWIAGAAVDAYAVEPLPVDHPLRKAPNILLTPHLASFARETGEQVSLTAAQAIVDYLQGRRPQFVVNPNVFQSASLRHLLKLK